MISGLERIQSRAVQFVLDQHDHMQSHTVIEELLKKDSLEDHQKNFHQTHNKLTGISRSNYTDKPHYASKRSDHSLKPKLSQQEFFGSKLARSPYFWFHTLPFVDLEYHIHVQSWLGNSIFQENANYHLQTSTQKFINCWMIVKDCEYSTGTTLFLC